MTVSTPSETFAPSSVLLVSEPGVDGVFQYVKNLAQYLLETGWRVHLAYSSQRGCPALFTLVETVEASGGKTLDLHVGNAPRPADARALARLRSLALETRPEIIHAHSSKAGVLVRALAFLGVQARFRYTPHAYYQMHGPMSGMKVVFNGIERALGRVGKTISVSGSEAEYARRIVGIAPENLRVVIAGVDCAKFRPADTPAEKREAREKFGLPAEALLLGTVARYTAQKDPHTLYAALIHSMTRHPALHFAHLGKGELRGEIDALLDGAPADVRSRVHRIEASAEADVFYRALDALTLPSRYEGFALSALEATATGLPLILTRCPGNTDLAEFGLDAIHWAETGDPVSVAAQIDAWVGSIGLANNHRETSLTRFDLKRAFESIVRCYQP